jgi:hypothetical protein
LVESDSVVLRRIWRKWYKLTLDSLFSEFESKEFLLTPDVAIEKMELAFRRILSDSGSEAQPDSSSRPGQPFRFDETAFTREAHHYAVDLFYRTYFPREAGGERKSRKGAPQLSIEYLDRVLKLSDEGLEPHEIAERLGQSDPQARDRIRKQILAGRKRYIEIVHNIRKLGAAQRKRLRAKRQKQSR